MKTEPYICAHRSDHSYPFQSTNALAENLLSLAGQHHLFNLFSQPVLRKYVLLTTSLLVCRKRQEFTCLVLWFVIFRSLTCYLVSPFGVLFLRPGVLQSFISPRFCCWVDIQVSCSGAPSFLLCKLLHWFVVLVSQSCIGVLGRPQYWCA